MSTQGDVLKLEVDDARDAAVIEAGFLPGWIGEGGLRPEPLSRFSITLLALERRQSTSP